MLDRANLRACLWAVLYCLLVVVGSGTMLDLGVSYFVVAPVALFGFPLLAGAPFLFVLKAPEPGAEEE